MRACTLTHTRARPHTHALARTLACAHACLRTHTSPACAAQAIAEYSADAMRWALADAGDGMDDANFETSTANAAILRLTKELSWMEEMLAPEAGETPRHVLHATSVYASFRERKP
eukprot:GHRQ01040261.1.p2 GENE.GHRQ01040261.1~~GHRQ01040261.1.p2  ORF type:complete len:116 (-),score=23.06 GHRQ01040261.1:50-397(-)